jgi:hypothetical protein
VKEPVKIPFVFLFILICATLVLAALNLICSWGLYDSAVTRFSLAYAARALPRSLSAVYVPAVVLSLVLTGFRMTRRPFSRFLGLLIMLGAGYLVLVNGLLWMRGLSGVVRPAAETPSQYLKPDTFLPLGDLTVSAHSVQESVVRDLLVFDAAAAAAPRFSVYPVATATVRAGAITLRAAGRPPLQVTAEPSLAWTGLFAPDRFTAAFLRDVTSLTADFQRLMNGSLAELFTACFALVFLCAASLMLLRITRWPLVNVMALVAAVRGYFSLYHWLAVAAAPRIAAVVTDRLVARLVPSAAFLGIGVLLLLVDILFIPADRWVAEKRI